MGRVRRMAGGEGGGGGERMTREEKLQYHLEIVICQSRPGVPMTSRKLEILAEQATPEQKEAAYQRALIHSPMLLDDERRPV